MQAPISETKKFIPQVKTQLRKRVSLFMLMGQLGGLLLLLVSPVYAQEPDWNKVKVRVTMQIDEELNWDRVIKCIIHIESSGNPNAYNAKTQAIGLMQITPIVLREYNMAYVRNVYNMPNEQFYYTDKDLLDPLINERIGSWYVLNRIPQLLQAYNIPDCIDYRLIAYFWGVGNLNEWYKKTLSKEGVNKEFGILPKEIKNYLKKFYKLYEEIE